MIQFELDKNSSVPFYRQIVDMVLAAIASGAILPGERLPTIRDLAVKLVVNPNTVVKAYSQLQMMGVLDTQQGSGVFIQPKEHPAATPDQKRAAVETLCRDFVGRAHLLNISIDDMIGELRRIRLQGPAATDDKTE